MFSLLRAQSKPKLPDGLRVYAIGDVHGRLDLYDRLIETIRLDNSSRPAADVTLIMLGDLIDRGPASRAVVNSVRAGVDWAKTIALMGNHEHVLLEVLDGSRSALEGWLRFGGQATLQSWGVPTRLIEEGTVDDLLQAIRAAITPEERSWLSRLRQHSRIGDYYFVHAGIRPNVALDKQQNEDRLWIREEFLESRKMHGAMIVHGHSISANVEEKSNRIGLDTGAYASDCLTALGLEGSFRWYLDTGSSHR